MKKFFEEYGKFSIAAIVIILLLIMIKPIGAAIQTSIENVPVPEISLSLDNESQLPQKGDLITIDSKQYRVLSINGNEAKLLAMYDATKMKFNDSNVTISFNGINGQKYESSKIDSYLENEFYPSLSFKDAIIEQNITQNMYVYTTSRPYNNYYTSWYKRNFTSADASETPYYIEGGYGSVNVGSRHVYALDIKDVHDYLGDNFTPQQLNTMFWNVDHYINKYAWLRSNGAIYSDSAWLANGIDGCLNIFIYNFSSDVRPAFIIDLSKVDYTK